jgi:uncharacterized protein YndB with AHSA1/START domain
METMTEPNVGELVLTRLLDAPRALVWSAWTDPVHFVRWFGPTSVTVKNCVIDPRPGGVIRFSHETADGSLKVHVSGVFEEVVEPQRLAMRLGFVDADGKPAAPAMVADWPVHARLLTIVTLAERGAKTLLTVEQRVVPPEAAGLAAVQKERRLAREGWAETLDRLDRVVVGRQ